MLPTAGENQATIRLGMIITVIIKMMRIRLRIMIKMIMAIIIIYNDNYE